MRLLILVVAVTLAFFFIHEIYLRPKPKSTPDNRGGGGTIVKEITVSPGTKIQAVGGSGGSDSGKVFVVLKGDQILIWQEWIKSRIVPVSGSDGTHWITENGKIIEVNLPLEVFRELRDWASKKDIQFNNNYWRN